VAIALAHIHKNKSISNDVAGLESDLEVPPEANNYAGLIAWCVSSAAGLLLLNGPEGWSVYSAPFTFLSAVTIYLVMNTQGRVRDDSGLNVLEQE